MSCAWKVLVSLSGLASTTDVHDLLHMTTTACLLVGEGSIYSGGQWSCSSPSIPIAHHRCKGDTTTPSAGVPFSGSPRLPRLHNFHCTSTTINAILETTFRLPTMNVAQANMSFLLQVHKRTLYYHSCLFQ